MRLAVLVHLRRERRHVWRWRRRRRAKQVVEYPLGAENRRRAVTVRCDSQDAALPEQPAPAGLGQFDPAEPVADHAGNLIMASQAFVEERVIGVEQFEDAAITA